MKSSMIRRSFLDFFESKNHKVLKSFPLVPKNDSSILWINAGMTPLKPFFKGEKVPDNPKMTSSQRCVRTNDIENVGKTPRHQTMFEMLGNFSIGDYFKKEAIYYSWEFLTKELNLSKERLFITVYEDDLETYNIWTKDIGVSKSHILKTKEDNFWDIGEGPCGPCSEIFYDTKIDLGDKSWHPDLYSGERYLEIWNLVFSEFNHNSDGSYTPLPKKNIDTGMGLERLSMILQNVESNFETDLFVPIIKELDSFSPAKYTNDSSIFYHAIVDHTRTVSMMIYDGEKPSNTERGYITRRLIRRSMRFGRKIGHNEPFLYQLVPVIIDLLKETEPLIIEKEDEIISIIKNEEIKFINALTKGERMVENKIKDIKKKNEKDNIFPGKYGFILSDSNGFPIDLLEEMCLEKGFVFDRETFDHLLLQQKNKSRKKST